jgi:hypothetical protein
LIKIGIVYICTGDYNIFWDSFYKSAEKNLFSSDIYEKYYFIVTTNNINTYQNNRIQVKYADKLEYPMATIHKFHYMLMFENEIKDMDYVYYFNCNSLFMTKIEADILPDCNDMLVLSRFTSVYFHTLCGLERNPNSLAYVNFDAKIRCCCGGGIIGGETKYLISTITKFKNDIDIDLSNGIIALWHDEAYLNKYLLTNKYKVMPPMYCYLELLKNGAKYNKNIKILILDKRRFGFKWK